MPNESQKPKMGRMPRSQHTYWLPIAIATAFLAVSVFGVITYFNTLAIRGNEAKVARSYAVRESTQQLISAMRDTETGQRGFLLTGDESFLAPYETGYEQAETQFKNLSGLAANDQTLAVHIEKLRSSFDAQQAHFKETIRLRRQRPATDIGEDVLSLVKSGRGKRAMDEARSLASQIVEAENQRLQETEATSSYLSSLSQATITAGHLTSLALILIAGMAAWLDRQKRDKAEARLLHEQAELAAVIASAFEGIVTFGVDWQIRVINPAAAEIFIVDPEEAVGRSFLEFIPDEHRDRFREQLEAFNRSAESKLQLDEQWMRRNDGSDFPTAGTASRTATGDDHFTTLRFRDLTEFQSHQAKQREYTAILEQINDAVLVCDLDSHIRSCNDSAERLLGFKEPNLVGKLIRELLHVEEDVWLSEREQMLQTGLVSVQRSWVSPAGREYVLEQRRSLIRDGEGNPSGKLIFLIDVTERFREETKQRRTQRLESIGTLAGGIAHDLNNVLTPIVMSAKLLQRGGGKTPERLIANIITAADRGGKMIKKLLAFAGGDEGQRTQVDLREILLELEEILSHTLPQMIDLRVSVPNKLRRVDADPTELSQVIMNLAINARDAMPDGGCIEIDVCNTNVECARANQSDQLVAGPHVLLTVADNGEGIPPEIIERVFDPFFTTKSQGKRTGLGLATTLGIIRSCGGDISVYSQRGVGTKFSIYLPSSKLAMEVSEREDEEEIPIGQGETILVVDDEPMILETARETLEFSGYQVITAASGTEAVAIYQHDGDSIDAVILDMMMPGMDGFETKDAIRTINPLAKVLASSGLRQPDRESGKMDDFNGCLAKPYNDEQLLRRLRSVVEQPS
jgi:PAS domain S-box-containing protein